MGVGLTGRVFKFVIFCFSMDLVWMGMVYLGKMCDSHRIALIPIDGASVAEAELIG